MCDPILFLFCSEGGMVAGDVVVGYLASTGKIESRLSPCGGLEVGYRAAGSTITPVENAWQGWQIYQDPNYIPPAEHDLTFKISYDGGATTHDLYNYLPGYDADGNAVLYTQAGGFTPQQITIVAEGLPPDLELGWFEFLSISQNGGFSSNATDESIDGEHENDDYSYYADRDEITNQWVRWVQGEGLCFLPSFLVGQAGCLCHPRAGAGTRPYSTYDLGNTPSTYNFTAMRD